MHIARTAALRSKADFAKFAPFPESGHSCSVRRKLSDGRLVSHQLAAEADQDRGARRPQRPGDHLPILRGGRHRSDGARHSRRHSPIAGATVMRATMIQVRTEQERQDRSARCAEKHGRYRRIRPIHGLIRPNRPPRTGAAAIRSTVRLTRGPGQPIQPLTGRPHGESRLEWPKPSI